MINGFEAGQLVVCTYRMPSALQPWIHRIYVGRVEEPKEYSPWRSSTTERQYCELTGKVPVNYGGVRQLDGADALVVITAEEAAMPHAEQVRRFLGEEAYENLMASSLPAGEG
jgi:hypothetical protein